MNKSSFVYILIGFILLGAPLYFFKGAIACEIFRPLGYEEVLPNVFIASDNPMHAQDLGFLVRGAKRVSNAFGDMIANPTIIMIASKQESSKFFASETATSHFSPFNNCLIIGPKGQNVDVVAHELVHAEIYERLGWLLQVLEMPRWFEEGVSLLVDLREPFLPANISLEEGEVETVKTIFYGHHFYNENTFKNYQAARLAVDSVDTSQFYSNLAKMKQGHDFDDVFDL